MVHSRGASMDHSRPVVALHHRPTLPVLFVSHVDDLRRVENGNEGHRIATKALETLKKLDPSVLSTPLVEAATNRPRFEGLTKIPKPLSQGQEGMVNQRIVSKDTSIYHKAADRLRTLVLHAVGQNEEDVLGYTTYPNHQEFPDVSLKELMKMMDGAPPLEYFLSPNKLVRLLWQLLQVNVGFAMTNSDVKCSKTAEDKYHAVFTKPKMLWDLLPNPLDLLPLPKHVVNSWDTDKEFARQFLNGVNPLMIRMVKDVPKDLSPEVIEFFQHDKKVDLSALIANKRILCARYDDLNDLAADPHQAFPLPYNKGKSQDHPYYFSKRPLAVFQLTQDSSELQILAIQLEQGGEVYSAATTDPNTWLFAKATVKSADAQMHEWVNHLGRTHLTMEPHILAIHNTLKAKRHPVFTFLRPLIKDTLFFNYLARGTLAEFGDNSFGDHNSAVGVGQFMQLIQKYWQRYNFFESSGFEQELASRGFDPEFDMPCYLYREDGKKLWKAYGEFAADFVNEVYTSDKAVAEDVVLQEWAQETTDSNKAAVPGFPTKFHDKQTLTKVLQTLFWIASGLHAAVNFPQYDYYAFLANLPLSIRLGMDQFQQSKDHSREFMFSNAFPQLDNLKEVIAVVRFLTVPSNHCIDKLSDNFKHVGRQSYRRFQVKLAVIGKDIEARNVESVTKGEPIYPYLHPSRVPASIDT